MATVTMRATSSAPPTQPLVMVGVAGASSCPASEAPFLGPYSCARGPRSTALPFSPIYPETFSQLFSLSHPLGKELNSNLSIPSSGSYLPTKQNLFFSSPCTGYLLREDISGPRALSLVLSSMIYMFPCTPWTEHLLHCNPCCTVLFHLPKPE